jgi:hypothetical protein
VLGIAPLDDDVVCKRLPMGVRGLGCGSATSVAMAQDLLESRVGADVTIVVMGCLFGASFGLRFTSVLSLFTTMGEV